MLDTSALSVLAPDRRDGHGTLAQWLAANEPQLVLSVVTLAELNRGIVLLAAKGASAKAQRYQDWLDALVQQFANRILGIDPQIALLAGQLDGAAKAGGFQVGLPDALIVATAKLKSASILTFNVTDFEVLGAKVIPLSTFAE